LSESRWDDDGTRPLAGRTFYRLPACTLHPAEGTPVRFVAHTVTIGSSPDNDLVLAADTVSRFHAQVMRLGDGYVVRDLESTNGTSVNGVRVREAFLAPGCTLDFGGARVRFEADEELLRLRPSAADRLDELVGGSPAMRQLYHLVEQVAPTDATVLIEGETGTGKDVFARVLHRRSRRADAPFVVVDCASIPANLLESELFGHEKGSFSGALTGRKGLFEMAHRGTVFLDEVGELPSELQPRLLRVLQTREVRRVGSNRSIPLDVRVLAATNRNLRADVEAGRFRSDLFFRLNVVPVYLPPLRERREDIPLLAGHFLAERFPGKSLSPGFLERLVGHPFPGNVRELVNLVERVATLGEEVGAGEMPSPRPLAAPPPSLGAARDGRGAAAGPTADVTRSLRPPPLTEAGRGELASPVALPSAEAGRGNLAPFKEAKELAVAEFEGSYLARLMEQSGGNISAAARGAGLDRKHLRVLLRKHGLYYNEDGI